jgi:transporter family-2 protein
MKLELFYMVLGVVAGICICLEGTLNSLLGRHVGVLKAALAPFCTGLVALTIIIIVFDKGKGIKISTLMEAPWYSYFGGVMAAIFVSLIILIVPKVGITAALTAIIVGQLSMSMFLDATGLFALERIPISVPRIIGVLLLLAGMRLIFMKPT